MFDRVLNTSLINIFISSHNEYSTLSVNSTWVFFDRHGRSHTSKQFVNNVNERINITMLLSISIDLRGFRRDLQASLVLYGFE